MKNYVMGGASAMSSRPLKLVGEPGTPATGLLQELAGVGGESMTSGARAQCSTGQNGNSK